MTPFQIDEVVKTKCKCDKITNVVLVAIQQSYFALDDHCLTTDILKYCPKILKKDMNAEASSWIGTFFNFLAARSNTSTRPETFLFCPLLQNSWCD